MRVFILDLQSVSCDDEWADCPARSEIENALLDYAGKIVKVQITISNHYKQSRKLIRHTYQQ